MVNWHLRQFSSFSLIEVNFRLFKNENIPNWSLTRSQIQIEKFQINAWLFYLIGCWFHSILLGWRDCQEPCIPRMRFLALYRGQMEYCFAYLRKLQLQQAQKLVSVKGIFLKIKDFTTVCSYHITYAFQSESTLCSCLNVKELLARNRRDIWSFK